MTASTPWFFETVTGRRSRQHPDVEACLRRNLHEERTGTVGGHRIRELRIRARGQTLDRPGIVRRLPVQIRHAATTGLAIVDAARGLHQGHENLVGHADDGVGVELAGLEFSRGMVGQCRHGREHARLVVAVAVHDQIDVHGAANVPRGANGESADHHVPGASIVQGAAQLPQILDGRLARR